MSLRADPAKLAEELEGHKKGIKAREDFDSFFEIVRRLSGFLELGYIDLISAKNASIATQDPVHSFMHLLGMPETIGYARYSSDRESLIRILREPYNCLVWERFCCLMEKDKSKQGILFFTLKGGVHMCMTNVPVLRPSGIVVHTLNSADKNINDVYIMELQHVPLMLHSTSLRG